MFKFDEDTGFVDGFSQMRDCWIIWSNVMSNECAPVHFYTSLEDYMIANLWRNVIEISIERRNKNNV